MMADVSFLLTALVSLISALVGGVIAHFLTYYRDNAARRKNVIVTHLIDSWRRLDKAVGLATPEDMPGLEQALGDIQLFGDDELIRMAATIAKDASTKGRASNSQLLNALRDKLRSELKLPKSNQEYIRLRFYDKSNLDERKP